MALGRCTCARTCEQPGTCPSPDAAPALLDGLPDSVLQQHLLPRLSGFDKKIFRLASARQRQLVNQCVQTVCVPANALRRSPPGTKLGTPFPAARALQAFDWDDAAITDDGLITFLSASGPWLEGVGEVNLKRCHYVTGAALAFLRGACPALKRLAPSRWADHEALAEVGRFTALEELDLGDADADVVTVDDLSLVHLRGLAPSLRVLGLSRCRWVSDGALDTIACLDRLERLDLSHTDVGARGLAALAALPNLKSLNLTGCRHVGDEALRELRALPALTTLVLRSTLATNDGLKAVRDLPRLAHLDLGSKWELNDAGLAAVASCPELKRLTVGSFNLARPVLGPQGLRKLQHLSFGGGFANKGLHLLFPLLNLQSLHVTGIDSVTDCVMRHVASQKQLQHLALRSGYSLTSKGLQQLAALANLAVLSVGACPAISRTLLEAFAAGHARLGMLQQGVCPLLSDTPDALCALAPEPALPAAHLSPCVRVN